MSRRSDVMPRGRVWHAPETRTIRDMSALAWASKAEKETNLMRHLRDAMPNLSAKYGKRWICLEQEVVEESKISHLEHAGGGSQWSPWRGNWSGSHQRHILVSVLADEG